jgi:hypothetical protein
MTGKNPGKHGILLVRGGGRRGRQGALRHGGRQRSHEPVGSVRLANDDLDLRRRVTTLLRDVRGPDGRLPTREPSRPTHTRRSAYRTIA